MSTRAVLDLILDAKLPESIRDMLTSQVPGECLKSTESDHYYHPMMHMIGVLERVIAAPVRPSPTMIAQVTAALLSEVNVMVYG